MLLAEVVYREDLASLAPPAAVAIVDPFVYSVSIAVPVVKRFLTPLTKHASARF